MTEAEKKEDRGPRRTFTTEQKLAILQPWHEGTPVTHVCWQHALNTKVFYRFEEAVGSRA